MKKLEIEFKGGFRQASKLLTYKHGANFAILVDCLIYIYNENLDNLIQTNDDQYSVKASNGFLSRATGIRLDTVKRQMFKIEEIGLVSATKKGQGNTKHYMIHIEDINTYIKALEPEFNAWFEKSLNNGKKEMSRSREADKRKEEERIKNLKAAMDNLQKNSGKEQNGLVQNQPSKPFKTNLPREANSAVVEREKDRIIETTTEPNQIITNDVVSKVFSFEDDNGIYTILEEFNNKKVYQVEYDSYIKKLPDHDLEIKLEDFKNQIFSQNLMANMFDPDEDSKLSEESIIENHSIDNLMMHIYSEIQDLENRYQRKLEREMKNTKKPASKDISELNFLKLENAYNALPPLKNQGKFFISQTDKEDFFSLSEYRQEWIIESVSKMRDAKTTTSRPSIYIKEAMKEKLGEVCDPNARLCVAI